MIKKLLYAITLALMLASTLAGMAAAQEPVPTPSDDDVNAVARELFCPVCENTPLDVCPTEACRQWRDLIRLQLSQGRTKEEIQQYFVDQYGARVLSEPPRTGLNWLVYIVPPALFLLGAVMLYSAMRSWRTEKAELPVPASDSLPTVDDDYVRKLEEELKKRK